MKSIDLALRLIAALPYAALAVYAALTEPPAILLFAVSATAAHELGHLILLWAVRAGKSDLSAAAFGLRITWRGRMLSHTEELLVALAGAAANIAVAALCLVLRPLSPDALTAFAAVNLLLAALNLLPISGLDGSRALGAALSLVLSPDTVSAVTASLSLVLSSIGCFFGLFLLLSGSGGLYIFCLFFSLLLKGIFAPAAPL